MSSTPNVPVELLKKLNPSQYHFLELVANYMSNDMINYIAGADYGYNKEKYFKCLKKIILHKKIAYQDYILDEVLGLTRWSKPESDTERKIIAFNNTVVLIAKRILDTTFEMDGPVLAGFIDAVYSLEKEYHRPALQLVVWCVFNDYEQEKKWYIDEDWQEDLDEIEVNEFMLYSLLLLMILNEEAEKDLQIIIKLLKNHELLYNNTNLPFLYANETFKPKLEIWKINSLKMLTQIEYIKDDTIVKTLKKFSSCIMQEQNFFTES